jgi:hypothetical protein
VASRRWRHAVAGIVLLVIAGAASAADKEATGTVVKVDLKESKLIITMAPSLFPNPLPSCCAV